MLGAQGLPVINLEQMHALGLGPALCSVHEIKKISHLPPMLYGCLCP